MHALNTTESAASALTCTQDTGHRTVQVLDRAAMCIQPGWQGASQSLLPRRRCDARDVRGRLCGRPGHQPVAVHAERAAADAGLHWRLRRRARPGGRRALPAVRDVLHKLLYHYTRHVCRSMFACHLRSLGCMMPHCAGHCMCCMRVWAAQCTPGMYSLRSSAAMPLIMLRSRGRGLQTCASTCICVPQQRYRPGNTPAARTVVTGGPVQPCTAYDRAQLAGTAGR